MSVNVTNRGNFYASVIADGGPSAMIEIGHLRDVCVQVETEGEQTGTVQVSNDGENWHTATPRWIDNSSHGELKNVTSVLATLLDTPRWVRLNVPEGGEPMVLTVSAPTRG